MNKLLRAMCVCGAVLMLTQGLSLAQPDCDVSFKTTSWNLPTGGTIDIISPVTFNDCVGCCTTITIEGLPAGWSIDGRVEGQYVFTRACDSSGVRIPVETYETIPVSVVGGGPIVLDVCTPEAEKWNSFEIHIQNQFLVRNELGQLVTSIGVQGNIAPGTGWDQTCRSTGCTPGYWKNHEESWDMTGIHPDDNYCSTFGLVGGDCPDPNLSMIEAVSLNGNKDCEALIRHSASALLNAAFFNAMFSPCVGFDFDYSVDQVKIFTHMAFADGSKTACNTAMNLFADANENSMCGIGDSIWFGILPGSLFNPPACIDGAFGISCNPFWVSPF